LRRHQASDLLLIGEKGGDFLGQVWMTLHQCGEVVAPAGLDILQIGGDHLLETRLPLVGRRR
jgi:hypothetical protein